MIRMEPIFNFGRLASADRLKPVMVLTQAKRFLVDLYLCSPFPAPPDSAYSSAAAAVIGTPAHVLAVDGSADCAEIAPPVVAFVAVDVVGVTVRKTASHVEKGQSMSEVVLLVDHNSLITLGVRGARGIAFDGLVGCCFRPDKYARLWVVVKDRFKVFLREFHGHLQCLSELGVGCWRTHASIL